MRGTRGVAVAAALVWLAASGGGCRPAGEGGGGEDGAVAGDEPGDVVEDVEAVPKAPSEPGSVCRCDGDCLGEAGHAGVCVFGICMTRASAACSSSGSTAECPTGSRCWGLTGFDGPICWPDCAAHPGCAGTCDSDGSCVMTSASGTLCAASCASYCRGEAAPPEPETGGVGAACEGADDCSEGNCYSNVTTGWVDGYCMIFGCTSSGGACGDGGVCVPGLSTDGRAICMQACGSSSECREGYVCRPVYGQDICWPGARCGPSAPTGYCPSGQSCVEGSCRAACSPSHPDGHCEGGLVCEGGACVAASGGGDCGSWECTGSGCGDLVEVPGATSASSAEALADGYYLGHERQYSYLRRDLAQLVAWAACRVRERFPGVPPLALLDMTEADGSTPGCPEACRHPDGTHRGSDLDTAYFQTDGTNDGQCICGDGRGPCWNGYADTYSDGYRCTTEANIVDLEQQVWFLASMAQHPGFRVVGVDDTLCADIRAEADAMLARGDIDGTIHGRITSLGCYSNHSSWAYHHHHLHFSFY